jgi:hypothetical protein
MLSNGTRRSLLRRHRRKNYAEVLAEMHKSRSKVAVMASALFLMGCGTVFPTDPEGTLERVSGGTIRVGASENGNWVSIPPSGDPAGSEPELIRSFAEKLGADVQWTTGTEHVLAESLKHGELDVVIAGLTDQTPWAEHAGLTIPYTESEDERGRAHKHVMLVPHGENAFLLELDRFLAESQKSQ